MTKNELSKLFTDALNAIHDATAELHDNLHPLGDPITNINNKTDAMLKRYMSNVREEIAGVRESIKEYLGE